jgi:hypothetical protein
MHNDFMPLKPATAFAPAYRIQAALAQGGFFVF